jgi:putative phage-type endonuclease
MSHLTDSRRHNVITASIAWSAVYERQKLWRQMTLREPPFEGNEMTEYGNIHEPIALSALEKEFDDIVEPGNKFVLHDKLPFGASPDGYYDGNVIEIKCPYSQEVYKEIPERYYFQMQMQMEVCKMPHAYFYIWTPNETKIQVVNRSKAWLEWYTPLALEFIKYVEDDIEPKRWTKKPIFNKE